jgi:hypothetical protein
VRVDWAIPCRYVEVQQGAGAVLVGAGADTAAVPTLPMPIQLLFAVRYVGAPDELDGEAEHPISCRIFNPAGDQIGEQSGLLKAQATQLIPGYVAELIVPTGVVLEPNEYGTYGFEFSIDESEKRVPMHIVDPGLLAQSPDTN